MKFEYLTLVLYVTVRHWTALVFCFLDLLYYVSVLFETLKHARLSVSVFPLSVYVCTYVRIYTGGAWLHGFIHLIDCPFLSDESSDS